MLPWQVVSLGNTTSLECSLPIGCVFFTFIWLHAARSSNAKLSFVALPKCGIVQKQTHPDVSQRRTCSHNQNSASSMNNCLLDKLRVHHVFRLCRTARSAVFAVSADLLLACSLANTACAIMNVMTTLIFVIFVSWSHAFFLVVVLRTHGSCGKLLFPTLPDEITSNAANSGG